MDPTMAINLIFDEYKHAAITYDDFNNGHEGYAVILEELDELWEDIKANKDPAHEAVQVGAMALRFLIDLC